MSFLIVIPCIRGAPRVFFLLIAVVVDVAALDPWVRPTRCPRQPQGEVQEVYSSHMSTSTSMPLTGSCCCVGGFILMHVLVPRSRIQSPRMSLTAWCAMHSTVGSTESFDILASETRHSTGLVPRRS